MILADWDLSFDVDDVLRGQGADPHILHTRHPQLVDLAAQALRESLPHLHPLVYFQTWEVTEVCHNHLRLENQKRLDGLLVMDHLVNAKQIAAVVCTVGEEIDQVAARSSNDDLSYSLAIEGVGAAAAEALGIAACEYLNRSVSDRGWQVTLPISPGMNGWPTDVGQHQLFQLIDSSEIGVTLTSDYLMLPQKSVSFVVGLGPDVKNRGTTCDFCAVSEVCRHRRN